MENKGVFQDMTLVDGTLCDECHDWTPYLDLTQLENGRLICTCCCDAMLFASHNNL